jgi:hypothetical protein
MPPPFFKQLRNELDDMKIITIDDVTVFLAPVLGPSVLGVRVQRE